MSNIQEELFLAFLPYLWDDVIILVYIGTFTPFMWCCVFNFQPYLQNIFSVLLCVWAAKVLFGNLRHAVLFVFSVPVFLKSWETCQFNNFMNRDFNQLQRFILAFSCYSLVLFCSDFFVFVFVFVSRIFIFLPFPLWFSILPVPLGHLSWALAAWHSTQSFPLGEFVTLYTDKYLTSLRWLSKKFPALCKSTVFCP